MALPPKLQQQINAVKNAKSVRFSDLIQTSGLDPKTDLRYGDWSFCDFSGCDLRGYDFTGARLWGANFTDALITGARFDQAEIGYAPPLPHDFFEQNAEMPWSFWQERGAILRSNDCDLTQAKDYREAMKRWQKPTATASMHYLPIGAVFQDAPFAPEMAKIPAGTFIMGASGIVREFREKKREHRLGLTKPFAMARYPVTFGQWDFAQRAGDWQKITGLVPYAPDDRGWGRDGRPVIHVSYQDALAFAKWLSVATGFDYSLPSEIEWEYIARGGSQTLCWWGDYFTKEQANYKRSFNKTMVVRSFEPNPFGLYQVHGNVLEWCVGCSKLHKVNGHEVTRGGSWSSHGWLLNSGLRSQYLYDDRNNSSIGFRLMRHIS